MVTKTTELTLPPPAANLRKTTQLPEAEETYQYEQPIGPQQRQVDANQYEQEAGPTRADLDAEKKLKFEREQEEWNLQQRQKAKAEEYEKEQEEIVKARQQKEITPKTFIEKVKKKLSEKDSKAVQPKEDLSDDFTRKKELKRMEYEHQERMQQIKQGNIKTPKKMARGQFKPATYGNFIDPFPGGKSGRGGTFPSIDPFGGMGGSGRNMLDFGFGPRTKPQKQQVPQMPQRPMPLAPVRKPKDINAAFGNPFAGIRAAAPKKAAPGSKTPNILKGFGKPSKTAKKRSWMDF